MPVHLARARGYALLADLIAGERAAIGAARDNDLLSGWLAGLDEAEVMAAHYQCLGRNAFPYAGVYLDPEGLISGDGDDFASALRRLGDLERRGDRPGAAGELASLLAWLPPLAIAVRRTDARPWPSIVGLAVGLVAEHAAELAIEPAAPALGRFEVDDSAGLGEIAAGLCLPYAAGFLLTSDGLRELARRQSLPTGFGSRRQMTRRFLESAAAFERGAAALAGLEDLVARTAADLSELSHHPGLTRACRPWIEQSLATRATLARMRAELSIAGGARVADG